MKFILLLTLFLTSIAINSQNFDFQYETDRFKQSKIISDIAIDLLKNYDNDDLKKYHDDRFRIEIVANRYKDALDSLNSLRILYKNEVGKDVNTLGIQYETYLQSTIQASNSKISFEESYYQVFDNLYPKLDIEFQDLAAEVFTPNIEEFENKLTGHIESIKNKKSITIAEAIKLCRLESSIQVYKAITPLSKPYFKNKFDEFFLQDDLLITTRDGAELSAIIIRPKQLAKPLPTVFVFNIYAGNIDKITAKTAARNGYVGIVVNTRGKKNSPQDIEPFEHDAKDAYDIIDWISKQAWSNGKVGMFGGSYLGFSQWASVKNIHPALKTIIPQVAVGIGIDYPMTNNVFGSYMLQWIHYVENNKTTDLEEFQDYKKWNSVYKEWYEKGISFRSLDSMEGRTNKTFQKWIDHPSYDAFWQNMTPQKEDFSNINIPVLTITGYFDVDQRGALHYFNEHYKYNSNANHYLLIGPYSHSGAQGQIGNTIGGYNIDSVAKIDINDIIYQWFDYALKNGKKPELIKNKVNYQVMGSNIWSHASSLKEMYNDELKFFLNNKLTSKKYSLSNKKPKKIGYIQQEIDFKERSDYFSTIRNSNSRVIDSIFPNHNGIAFISEPFSSEFEMNGSFTGQINLEINKKDVDIKIAMYEVTPNDRYFKLSTYLGRASYAKNKSKRNLLRPNIKEEIPINNTFLTSTLIAKGSRLLVVLSVNKNPNQQINYGTGKDVSDETIKDAEIPLQIKWFNDSFVKIPIKK